MLKSYLQLAMEDKRDSEEYQLLDKNESLEVRVALKVCKRKMFSLGEMLELKGDQSEITEKEW